MEQVSNLSKSPSPLASIKRKSDASNDSSKKRIKTKKAKSASFVADEKLDFENGINTTLSKLDGRLLADYVAQKTKRFGGDLSLVELEDMHIPERAFRDTSDWERTRKLDCLPDFLIKYSSQTPQAKNLFMAPQKNGTPHTLVVASAGLRAADLTRVLRTFQTKEAIVAKLFAKHIKLKDAVEYVKKTRMGIGVGTPSRIIDLLDAGVLSSDKLERIIVDCSYIDQKRRGIFDMRETQQPLMELLNRPELKCRYGVGDRKLDLLFY